MLYLLRILAVFVFLHFQVSAAHKIYIIHGYASSKLMMSKLTRTIRNDHFKVENYGYRSMRKGLDSLGKELYLHIKNEHYDTISFVSHSMGGLVVRSMLQFSQNDPKFPVIHRMVMIAPPNKGAELADFGSSFELLKFVLGPNVEKMKTTSDAYVAKLPLPLGFDVGIIAGQRGKKVGYNLFIKEDNDGLLSTNKTKLGTEKDFICVRADHNSLLYKKFVGKLTLSFLRNGIFVTNEE
ncbi:MAG: hypothetical protein RL264_2972 [Bacteroidota bacterium]